MAEIELFTDGACSGNPGPGGWGVLLRYQGHEKELSGGADATTNNRMEMTAVIEGLKAIKRPSTVTIYTDSRYVMDGIEKHMPAWLRRNWKTSDNKPVKNQDLWQAMLDAMQPHNIRWQWVKGHAGVVENERVDALARAAIPRLTPPVADAAGQ